MASPQEGVSDFWEPVAWSQGTSRHYYCNHIRGRQNEDTSEWIHPVYRDGGPIRTPSVPVQCPWIFNVVYFAVLGQRIKVRWGPHYYNQTGTVYLEVWVGHCMVWTNSTQMRKAVQQHELDPNRFIIDNQNLPIAVQWFVGTDWAIPHPLQDWLHYVQAIR